MHGFRRGFLAAIALILILISAFDAPSLLAHQGQYDTIRVVTHDCLRAASDFACPSPSDYMTISYDGLLWTVPALGETITNSRSEIAGFRDHYEARQSAVSVNKGIAPVDMKVIAKDTILPRLE